MFAELFTEGKKDYVVLNNSYTDCVEEMKKFVDKNGYEISEDEMWQKVSVNSQRPSDGDTTRLDLELTPKAGTKVTRNKKYLHAQVFGRGTRSKNYELNMYIS